MHTVNDLKAQAKRLRRLLSERKIHLTHSQALEAIAEAHGFRDWNTAVATADAVSTPQTKVVTPELYAALEATARERQLDNLDELIRSDLLQQIAAIERMGPPGIIDSVKQMLIALKEKRLPEPVAGTVGIYLFGLPGFRNGWQDDAEAFHQQLLAQRPCRD